MNLPLTGLLAFCSILYVAQGLVIIAQPAGLDLPAAPDTSGGFFQDISAIGTYSSDLAGWLFDFITFDLVPGLPWFFQLPLAIICGGSLMIAAALLIAAMVEAIGSLLPFT